MAESSGDSNCRSGMMHATRGFAAGYLSQLPDPSWAESAKRLIKGKVRLGLVNIQGWLLGCQTSGAELGQWRDRTPAVGSGYPCVKPSSSRETANDLRGNIPPVTDALAAEGQAT